MPQPRTRNAVEDYRQNVEVSLERVLTILAGRPDVTDPTDPDNYHNSLSGRIDRVVTRQDDLERRSAEAIKALRDAIEAIQQSTFGWAGVTDWLKRHWGKVLLAAVLLVLERDRALGLIRAFLGVPAEGS